MKPKRLICLALVLSGNLLIAFFPSARLADWILKKEAQQPSVIRIKAQEGKWTKNLKIPWADTKIVLYRASGEVATVEAKSAVYTVVSVDVTKQHKPFDVPAIAFIDPKTRNVWIGWAASGDVRTNEFVNEDHATSLLYLTVTNLFIETGSEIINGEKLLHDGTFGWQESVIKQAKPGESLDAMIARIEKDADDAWLFGPVCGTSGFDKYFQRDFFSSGNLGTQSTPIHHIEVSNGRLRLDFNSLQYRTTASVWLDLKTMKVLKIVKHK